MLRHILLFPAETVPLDLPMAILSVMQEMYAALYSVTVL